MATLSNHPYRYTGVHVPWKDARSQWVLKEEDERDGDGFIHVKQIQDRPFESSGIAQSLTTSLLYLNRVVHRPRVDNNRKHLQRDIGISTSPYASRRLPGPLMVRGRERTYFREIGLWQDMEYPISNSYSMYHKHYNGGTLGEFIRAYKRRGRAVPEHFIWHLLLTLTEAVRYLKSGALPGTLPDANAEDKEWIPIHHRHISAENIYLHYADQDGPEPEDGWEENAFPEIILGNFTFAAIEGDTPTRIFKSRWDEPNPDIHEWHDVYSIGHVAKEVYLAGARPEVEYPELCSVDNAFRRMDDAERAYTPDLCRTLERFEYDDCEQYPDILGSQPDIGRGGRPTGETSANWLKVPEMRNVVRHYLPEMLRAVRKYRKPRDGIPVGWWKQLDVSWTRPRRLLPYEWQGRVINVGDNANVVRVGHEDSVERNRAAMGVVRKAELMYPDTRPQFHVNLEFGLPVVSEIRQVPPRPTPGMPEELPPTPPGWLYVPASRPGT
ncbi:hypothetical protein F5Y08DRAFT_343972 [Xylaria arbuscula]|nr:hypothetical protein F5Y08DRAFT_343972 [Xylaria arbuscula]